MTAAYTFTVTFQLDPEAVDVDPAVFETTLSRPAPPPGEDGWLFFRDNLWRGELTDSEHLRAETEAALGVPVRDIEYEAFHTDTEYWTEFRSAIAADLTPFRADSVTEVISKYLGSSVERTQ